MRKRSRQFACVRSPNVNEGVRIVTCAPLFSPGLRTRKKRRLVASAILPIGKKNGLVHPFFFVIESPMTRHPFLGGFHRDVLPFLQIRKNGKGRKRLARVAFNADHLGLNLNECFFLIQDAKPHFASDRGQRFEIYQSARFANIFRGSKNVYPFSAFLVDPTGLYRHIRKDSMV